MAKEHSQEFACISINLTWGGVVAHGKTFDDFIHGMHTVTKLPDFRAGFVDGKRDSRAFLIKQEALVGQRVRFNLGFTGVEIHD